MPQERVTQRDPYGRVIGVAGAQSGLGAEIADWNRRREQAREEYAKKKGATGIGGARVRSSGDYQSGESAYLSSWERNNPKPTGGKQPEKAGAAAGPSDIPEAKPKGKTEDMPMKEPPARPTPPPQPKPAATPEAAEPMPKQSDYPDMPSFAAAMRKWREQNRTAKEAAGALSKR